MAAQQPKQAKLVTEQTASSGFSVFTEPLVLSSKVTLALEKESLAISDRSAKKSSRLCGLPLQDTGSAARSIPYYNILWASVGDDGKELVIDFADSTRRHTVTASKLRFAISNSNPPEGDIARWIESLLDRAYGCAARRKRAWVLVNPFAGPGGAEKIWEHQVKPIFDAARIPLTVIKTSRKSEAVDLAEEMDIDAHDIAVPCSGDGLPHEIFNGLAKRPDARRALSKIAVCHIPCGSGNAMSCNLYGTNQPSLAALAIVKGIPTALDLVSITQGDKRYVSFLSQSLGMIADLDITTEHMRFLGQHRFTVGFIQLAFQRKVYPCDIACKVEIEHKEDVKAHYRTVRERRSADPVTQLSGSESHSQQSEGTAAQAEDGPGLPPLRYGTVMDKLPEGWELIPYENLGTLYCGNMAFMTPTADFFSAALASDGYMDLITINGNISPFKQIGLQQSVESGHFFDSPLVSYRKVSAYRVIPRSPQGIISIDGEAFDFSPFQAEVHQGLGLTLSKNGIFESKGPKDWDKIHNRERLLA